MPIPGLLARHRDADFLVNYFTLGLAVRVVAVAGQLVIGFFFYRGEVDFVSYWHYAQELFNKIVLEGQLHLLFDDQYIKDQFFARSAMVVSLMVLAMMGALAGFAASARSAKACGCASWGWNLQLQSVTSSDPSSTPHDQFWPVNAVISATDYENPPPGLHFSAHKWWSESPGVIHQLEAAK